MTNLARQWIKKQTRERTGLLRLGLLRRDRGESDTPAVLDVRAAFDKGIPLSRPIQYDNGSRAEGAAALGQSLCVLANTKVSNPRADAWAGRNPYGLVQWKIP